MRWFLRSSHWMLKMDIVVMNGALAPDHAAAEPYARRLFRRAA